MESGTSAKVREYLASRNISLGLQCTLSLCTKVSAAGSEGAQNRIWQTLSTFLMSCTAISTDVFVFPVPY